MECTPSNIEKKLLLIVVQQLEDKNPGNLIDQKLPSGPNDKLSPPGVIVPENQKHPDHQNEEVFQGIFNNEATPSPGKNPDDKVKDLGQNSKETPGADHQKISHNDLNLEDGLDNTEHHNSDGNLKNRDQTSENSLDASLHTLHEDLNLKDVLDDSDRHNLVLDDDTRNQHEHQDETQDNLHQGYKEIPGVQEELIVPSKYPTTKTDQQDTINYPFVSTSTHYPDTFETPENQIHPYLYPQMGPPYPDTFEAPENNQINPHLYPQMTPPYPDPLGLPEHNQIYPYQNPHLGYQNYLDDFQNQLPFNSYAPQFPYYQDPYTYYQNPFSFYQNPYQNDFLSQYHPRNFYNSQTTRWQKFKNFMQKPINSLKHHFNNLSDKVKNWFKLNNNDQVDKVEDKSLTLKDFANPEIVQRFLENLSQVLSNIKPMVYDRSEVVNYAKKTLDAIVDSISKYIMHK